MDTDTIYTLHLFAGAGGGILGDLLLGHIPVGAVEIEAYPRKVLLARQLDGSIPRFPIWDDVCTFRSDNHYTTAYIERLRGIRDRLCICGGFPCQDISCAGKGAGLDGERSGLWREFARIIGEIRPAYVFIENSPMLVVRGLNRVVCDLAEMGYDSKWGVFSAGDVGARHIRERLWILAYTNKVMYRKPDDTINSHRKLSGSSEIRGELCDNSPISRENLVNTYQTQRERVQRTKRILEKYSNAGRSGWWKTEPDLGRVANGVAAQMDRLAAIGNGQCPQVVKLAWEMLNAV